MIDYISGDIAELTPGRAIIDCGGIGYELNISLTDYTDLQSQKKCKLYVHESIREDSHILDGFISKRGREIFKLLIGVSGVGPSTARVIMSALKVSEIELAISSGNDSALKAVKGIGGKTAQRIIVDLKDKINAVGLTLSTKPSVSNEIFEESLAALVMLGFSAQQSQKVLVKILGENPDIKVEVAIKMALKML